MSQRFLAKFFPRDDHQLDLPVIRYQAFVAENQNFQQEHPDCTLENSVKEILNSERRFDPNDKDVLDNIECEFLNIEEFTWVLSQTEVDPDDEIPPEDIEEEQQILKGMLLLMSIPRLSEQYYDPRKTIVEQPIVMLAEAALCELYVPVNACINDDGFAIIGNDGITPKASLFIPETKIILTVYQHDYIGIIFPDGTQYVLGCLDQMIEDGVQEFNPDIRMYSMFIEEEKLDQYEWPSNGVYH